MEKNLIIDISENLNKKLPSNVTTFAEIPSENFMIFKNSNLIIFQSPFQENLFWKYNDESFNNYLNNLLPIKPSFYELINKLNELEHLSYYDYQRKIRGVLKIKKKKRAINKTNEISVLIERYNNIEAKLIDAKCDRNNIINLWFDGLTDLNKIK
ncbi:hypothetical protein U3516DRAFT_767282 [Neocallimastix sp. 'constans']